MYIKHINKRLVNGLKIRRGAISVPVRFRFWAPVITLSNPVTYFNTLFHIASWGFLRPYHSCEYLYWRTKYAVTFAVTRLFARSRKENYCISGSARRTWAGLGHTAARLGQPLECLPGTTPRYASCCGALVKRLKLPIPATIIVAVSKLTPRNAFSLSTTGHDTDSVAALSICLSSASTYLLIALNVSIYSRETICCTGWPSFTVFIQR